MTSPELQNQIAIWRQKAAANTLSIEEMREAIAALRGSRKSASEASAASKAKPRASSRGPSRSADDLLKDLEGL